MKPDESTKDYVTRLWALVSRLTDLPDLWRERTILTALRMGHARLEVCDLLIKENPKTIADAERIAEEFEARQQTLPVTTKFAVLWRPPGQVLQRLTTSRFVEDIVARKHADEVCYVAAAVPRDSPARPNRVM
jgi:hypothetical protein